MNAPTDARREDDKIRPVVRTLNFCMAGSWLPVVMLGLIQMKFPAGAFCFAIGVSWAALVVQIHPSVRANNADEVARVRERNLQRAGSDSSGDTK